MNILPIFLIQIAEKLHLLQVDLLFQFTKMMIVKNQMCQLAAIVITTRVTTATTTLTTTAITAAIVILSTAIVINDYHASFSCPVCLQQI